MTDWRVAPTQLITTAIIDMLKAAFGAGARVYDHRVPEGATHPYWMVSHLPGGDRSGPPLVAPDSDAALVFQVDGVALRRDAAQLAADRAVDVMIGRNAAGGFVRELVMPSGWALCDRMPSEGSGGVEQEGAPPNVVYTAPNRFTVVVTPTS